MMSIDDSRVKKQTNKTVQLQGAGGCNMLIRPGEIERKLFMVLLQQKCLTYDLILKWIATDDLQLQQGKRSKLYYRIYRLVKTGYLKKQTIDGQDVYLLSQGGLDAVHDINSNSLPLVSVSELETIRHDLLTAEIRHYLESYGATCWVSDREFRLHEDKMPYVPDGACTFEGLTVFLEIELSQKSIGRYEKIAEVYTSDKGPDRVLYFYQDDSVIEGLKGLVSKNERMGFFKYNKDIGPPAAVTGICASANVSLSSFLGLS